MTKRKGLGQLLSNNPYIVFPLHFLAIAFFYNATSLKGKDLLMALFFGGLWESWLEFGMHRWVLHFPQFVPERFSSERAYYVVHGHHHRHPTRLPFFPLPHAVVLFLMSLTLFTLTLPKPWVYGVAWGGEVAFVLFEFSHWWIHQGINVWWAKPMETFHLMHHTSSRVAYGFVTPFWDLMFGCTPAGFPFPILPIPIPVVSFIASAMAHLAMTGQKAHAERPQCYYTFGDHDPVKVQTIVGEPLQQTEDDKRLEAAAAQRRKDRKEGATYDCSFGSFSDLPKDKLS